MAEEGQRDRSIERMLRHGAGAPVGGPASAECVDAETLAAWTAGALRHAEAARVEHHVADCARCQAMLAVFVRTEPPAPVRAAWWRRREVRWLVPLATAAAVAAIWVAIPDRDVAVRAPEQQAARPPVVAAPPPKEGVAAAPDIARQAELKAESAEKRSARRGDAAPTRDQPRMRDDQRAAAPASPAAAAPKPPQALQERITVGAESAAIDKLAASVVEIVSPDASARWRILGGRRVERSLSGGAQWEPVALPAPVLLTAGHSPAPSIAWLVGRAGAIYVTTDGSRFERIAFLETADVVSVVAVDDRQGTVTTADGRQFTTTDRGATWTPR